jgi:hypothetical protein
MVTMRSIQLLVSSVVLSAFAASAFGQGAPPPPPPPPGGGGSGGGGSGGAAGWPEAISDRPYTLNNGMVEIHGAMPIFGAGGSDNFVLVGAGASLGVSDQLEIGGDYAFELAPSADVAGVFAGHLSYRLVHNSQMSAALGVGALYSHGVDGVLLTGGLSLRYRLNPQLSIFTDSNICGQCLHAAGPVLGQGFAAIPGKGNSIVGFTLPVGLGYQVDPHLYLFGSTILAAVLLAPTTDSATIFSDAFIVTGGGWITLSNKFELGGQITDDVEHAGDNYFFELMGRVFM